MCCDTGSNFEGRQLSSATINLRLAAVRRLAYEATDTGLLSPELAAGIPACEGLQAVRLGNWLTAEQSRALLQAPDQSLKGRRDRAILAVMLASGAARSRISPCNTSNKGRSTGSSPICFGKAAQIRTVPVPGWVKAAIDGWITAAEITAGPLFRCISRRGTIWGEGITEKVVWHVVKESAAKAGIGKLAPHDCRRACARLCHAACGECHKDHQLATIEPINWPESTFKSV